MRQSLVFTALVAASTCMAGPIVKRSNFDAPPGGDIDILNYALTLEYLERDFYMQGLKNYTYEDFCKIGLDQTFYNNLKQIAYDETQHVSYLAGALGDAAVKEATYRFPSTDARSFLALASVLEGVGVSAYLGAAGAIANKAYLTVAGSILTVEARHSSYIRAALRQVPFPKPYDTPLDFNQVYSLASQFITGFAAGSPTLPFMAFPALTVVPSTQPHVYAGKTSLTFKGAYTAASKNNYVSSTTPVYAVIFSGLDTYYAPVSVSGGDYVLNQVPGAGFSKAGQLAPSGQSYVVLSTANGASTKVSDETTLSGVGILEVAVSATY